MSAKLGKPARLLVGLGTYNEPTNILSQNLHPDIYDQYLVGVGSGSWPEWNSPSGAYVGVVATKAESVGAVPMYTLYQMASNGDGNLAGLTNTTFMTGYWANVKLLFEQLAIYNKPALVNFEPDFWGYVQLQSSNNPAGISASVTINSDCAALPNNAIGVAKCLVTMARKYAPKAYVGFMPSAWAGSTSSIVTFMNTIGANTADFVVMETLDRDAGCFEKSPQPSYCTRTGSGWYLSDANYTTHLTAATAYHNGIGGLPLLWWQTPMGVASSTAGGTDYHYRDNHVQYFLTHPAELVAAGAVGVVFSGGESHQTNITTDGGQFQSLSTTYFANPAPLN
ncbi:MAG: hypothetical protein QM808_07365 [Steroidobacteraceae bacterium]